MVNLQSYPPSLHLPPSIKEKKHLIALVIVWWYVQVYYVINTALNVHNFCNVTEAGLTKLCRVEWVIS